MTRPMIEYIKKAKSGCNLIGIEIGVYEGSNALNIMRKYKIFLIITNLRFAGGDRLWIQYLINIYINTALFHW